MVSSSFFVTPPVQGTWIGEWTGLLSHCFHTTSPLFSAMLDQPFTGGTIQACFETSLVGGGLTGGQTHGCEEGA